MKILVYGEDNYRSQSFIRSLSTSSIQAIDRHENLESAIQSLAQIDLFRNNSDRVVVFRNQLKELKPHYQNLAVSKLSIVIWEETAKITVPNELKPHFVLKELRLFSPQETKRWLTQQCQSLGLQLPHQIITELVNLHGSNLAILGHELEKIRLYYAHRKGVQIDFADLNRLSLNTTQSNIFALTDSIGSRNKVNLYRDLRKTFSQKVDEWHVFYMIVKHMRNLYKQKLNIPLNIHPYAAQKAKSQSQNWQPHELFASLHNLLTIEFRVKTGLSNLKPELLCWLIKTAVK